MKNEEILLKLFNLVYNPFKIFLRGISDLIISLLWPSKLNNLIKTNLLRIRGAKIGRNVIIYQNVFIDVPKNIEIGDNVVISHGVIITCSGGVTIEKNSMIGYHAKILSANHIIPVELEKPIRFSGHSFKRVKISENVWVGANAVILPGTEIAKGSVIAAGAVVPKDVEPYTIVGGIPAKVIKRRR